MDLLVRLLPRDLDPQRLLPGLPGGGVAGAGAAGGACRWASSRPATPRRADFGLPDDRFVFLFVFDYLSFVERKNPRGLLRAFQRAFQPADPVLLVIKTINSEYDPEAAARAPRRGRRLAGAASSTTT